MDYTIEKYKPIAVEDMFVGPVKTYCALTQTLASTFNPYATASTTLCWSLIDPTDNTDFWRNLSHSFGLAREDDDTWWKSFEIIDHIKAGKMAVAYVPKETFGTYAQGSTIILLAPTGTGLNQYTKFYGASWNGYVDQDTNYEVSSDFNADSRIAGSAAVYLFKDPPYTGTVNRGQEHPNAGLASWTGANINGESIYPNLRATVVGRGDNGHDIPEGVVLLEKGIVVLFDNVNAERTFVTTNMTGGSGVGGQMWTAATSTTWVPVHDSAVGSGTPSYANNVLTNRKYVFFTGTNAEANSKLYYRPIIQQYKTVYFCHAGQAEFNSTSNHTYNHRKAYFRPDEADSVYITEVGLYNNNNDLVAYGKLSEPIRKDKLETLTIKVELVI